MIIRYSIQQYTVHVREPLAPLRRDDDALSKAGHTLRLYLGYAGNLGERVPEPARVRVRQMTKSSGKPAYQGRESRILAPARPRMQAAGLQCLELQIAAASPDPQISAFPGTSMELSRKTRSQNTVNPHTSRWLDCCNGKFMSAAQGLLVSRAQPLHNLH